jgi:hypothetical protein
MTPIPLNFNNYPNHCGEFGYNPFSSTMKSKPYLEKNPIKAKELPRSQNYEEESSLSLSFHNLSE